ncbi:MAG: DUF1080 domain-containing protein [Verrucomicrobia bacterium]|nr:DUF1080 domain-containing protein [Verrucomicrobiota bacterium]
MRPSLPTLTLAACLSLPFQTAGAAEQGKFWTDPAVAGQEDPDFLVQGEYGSLEAEKPPFAVQVVALGDGKFDAYFLEGGLPGQGWTREKQRVKVSGEWVEGGLLTFGQSKDGGPEKAEPVAVFGRGTLQATWLGQTYAMTRVERKSPTLGAKAPEGAVVLFDGTNADQWKNGEVENGLLASTGTTSIPVFKDCTIHVEFRTPYKPSGRGQGRGNSGIYYAGRWETQVLDSFGLTGEMNECGGIYQIAKPRLNMCLPPLSWQTYDVEYTAPKFDGDGKRTAWARMTVKLNGVVVHEDQELAKLNTTAAPIGGELKDEGGPLFLQAHGNAVFYRNIWVLPKE